VTLVAAASNAKALWYATRGTGVVALLLLTAAVVLGTLSSARWRSARVPRFLVGGLHRNLTLLSIAFVAAHVVTAVADSFAPIGLKDGIVPFLSPYRPLWLGLGTVAFDLLLALVITSLLRARLGFRMWRATHWLAYASWPVALVHAFGTGSDARFGWMALVGFGSLAAVLVALLFRIARSAAPLRPRAVSFAAATVVPLVVLGWYLGGPNQRGWAARAGTPAKLLRHVATASTQPIASVARQSLSPQQFDSTLRGRLTQAGPRADGLVTITIHAKVEGHVQGRLRITLWGEPSAEGGVALTTSSVAFGAKGTTLPYVGRVISLAGNRVDAELTTQNGAHLQLTALLALHGGGAVSGTLRGTAT
jgi:sulfoxide reductase heme-binding subunit YedZ